MFPGTAIIVYDQIPYTISGKQNQIHPVFGSICKMTLILRRVLDS